MAYWLIQSYHTGLELLRAIKPVALLFFCLSLWCWADRSSKVNFMMHLLCGIVVNKGQTQSDCIAPKKGLQILSKYPHKWLSKVIKISFSPLLKILKVCGARGMSTTHPKKIPRFNLLFICLLKDKVVIELIEENRHKNSRLFIPPSSVAALSCFKHALVLAYKSKISKQPYICVEIWWL